jgi:hypothetical protein
LIKQYNTIETLLPDQPELMERQAYDSVDIIERLNFDDIIASSPVVKSQNPLPMEKLPINHDSGQSYGYIVYRQEGLNIAADSILTITGHVRDTVVILINGVLISKPLSSSDDLDGFGYWRQENSNITLTSEDLSDATLDIVIENWGRANGGHFYAQYKGLTEDNEVYLNDQKLSSWTIYPLEFKKSWIAALTGWKSFDDSQTAPTLYRGTLTVEGDPKDTFIDMQEWMKGVVFVNGFALGKYADIGPQQTLYLPGPFLQEGENEIVIFEEFGAAAQIKFSQDHIFTTH